MASQGAYPEGRVVLALLLETYELLDTTWQRVCFLGTATTQRFGEEHEHIARRINEIEELAKSTTIRLVETLNVLNTLNRGMVETEGGVLGLGGLVEGIKDSVERGMKDGGSGDYGAPILGTLVSLMLSLSGYFLKVVSAGMI